MKNDIIESLSKRPPRVSIVYLCQFCGCEISAPIECGLGEVPDSAASRVVVCVTLTENDVFYFCRDCARDVGFVL